MGSQNSNLGLPPAASTVAHEVDSLYGFTLYTSIFFFLLITIGTLYFAFKYRRRGKAGLTYGVDHNLALEIVWTAIPSLILLFVFVWGFKLYLKMAIVPKDAMQIKVTGQKWFWSFDYPNGATTVNELVVPIGKPVHLLMSSKDVIHSFFVPAFRNKFDVVPNRYTQMWFEPTQTGEFHMFCTEYCGTKHSEMVGKVKVMQSAEYEAWLQNAGNANTSMPLKDLGAKLYTDKACFTCHSIDGSKVIGPTFKGAFGRTEKFADGSQVKVDENYIRESVLTPQKRIVEGYQPVMPTYQGVLKDREIDALIEYIKSLK